MGERIMKKCAWLICVICIAGSGVAPDDAYAQSTGNIVGWGAQVVVEPSDLSDLVAVAGGRSHSLGLKSDGTIVAWGRNDFGQCDVPVPNADFVAVAGGYSHSLGIKNSTDCNGNGILDGVEIIIHPSLDFNNDGILDECQPGITGVETGDVPVQGTVLHDPYPNPFNPQTTIAFELPSQTAVRLAVYDVSGRLVDVIIDGEIVSQGRNEVVWRGRDMAGRVVSAGVYFYRLEAGSYSKTKRMVLIK